MKNRTTRTTIAAAAIAGAMALAACGGPDHEPTPIVPDHQVVVPGPTSDPEDPASPSGEDTGETAPGDGQTAAGNGSPEATPAAPQTTPASESTPTTAGEATAHERELLDAIQLAEAAVPGTRAIELEREDDGRLFEIEMTDGMLLTQVEVRGGEAFVMDSEHLDGQDMRRFEASVITMREAIRKALNGWPGIVEKIELDDDDDDMVVHWELKIHQGDDDVEIYVDATTGEAKLDD
ncbi:MAG TPA: hypothetical protein GX743_10755 [Actinomycetales bacterium]|nr:hypothetical protein [Actinomycetales bacterium]